MRYAPWIVAATLVLCGDAARADASPANTNDVGSLTPEEAKQLVAKFAGRTLHLNGLTTLDAATAEALAESRGGLQLGSLRKLDPDAARAFAGFKGHSLELNGLTSLDAETAAGFAGAAFGGLSLQGLTTLDAETAEALATFKGGHLVLSGVTNLSAETARALADFKGLLQLSGLTTLDAATAAALVAFKGERLVIDTALLNLGGTIPATPDHARLAAADDRMHELPNITALDSADAVEIARALATRKGPLSLPNLKKVSPKTLSALIEKKDIAIPRIETLELIQEPDGSPTDDFVIPEWLEQRQRQQP